MGAVALAKEPPALDDAVTHLTQAAKLDSTDASVQANLGEALLRQGKLDDASKAFEKAMKLDPNRQDAGANRARAIINGLDVVAGELRKMAAASA
jgi:Flp pilus assembly protein TadD